MRTSRRLLPLAVGAALVLLACGGSDDDADTTDATAPSEAPAETEAPAATDAPAETEAPAATDAPAATEAPAETEAPAATDAPAAGEVDATLVEWEIEAPAEYAAGEITFNAINGGSFTHELVVIAGDSYEALPLADNGAVIEEDLPTGALIGRTSRIDSGATEALTVDLAPGNYVLLCNIAVGPNSHAGAGQRLDITVS
jgi:hypothetical protein